MSDLATIVAVLLGVVFLASGVPKILRLAFFRERIRHWRLPAALLPVIGLVEVAGAALLLVGSATQASGPALAGASMSQRARGRVSRACRPGRWRS